MIPSVLSSQLRRGIEDYLRASFQISTPYFHTIIDDLLNKERSAFKKVAFFISSSYFLYKQEKERKNNQQRIVTKMTEKELNEILDELLALPAETDWVEFKAASEDYAFEKTGKYFSALCNEANLKGRPYGWLVFGIENKSHRILGTNYRQSRHKLDSLKHEVAQQTTSSITFVEIHEINRDGQRIVLFQVPAAPRGIPVAWQGHMYGRYGESLVALSLSEIETIRAQNPIQDWSAQICGDATIEDLDPKAIEKGLRLRGSF